MSFRGRANGTAIDRRAVSSSVRGLLKGAWLCALAVVVACAGAPGSCAAQAGPTAGASPAANPDRPIRTSSGRVDQSQEPRLPPALGPYPAKVLVVVFSDFQCPVCERATDATYQIAEEWPGDVRVEFFQHPLAMHADAENAAVASLAAHRQGRFWPMHDALFAHQAALDPASLAAYAQEIGLDVDRFRRDSRDPALRARARREGALAERLGITGTPGFLINGRVQVGWGSWLGFRKQVEQEIAAVDEMLAKGADPATVSVARAKQLASDEAAFAAYKTGVLDPLAAARRRNRHAPAPGH